MQFHTLYNVASLMMMMIFLSCNTINVAADISLDQAIQQQLHKEQDNYEHTHHTSLKRKRRYLEFPEGSSFQLVYDLIVGVVDYTNYLILGVTVALAWELPSKPPSEIFSDLKERLKDGTLGTSRNDTVLNIKYVDIPTTTNNTKLLVLTKLVKTKRINVKLEPIFKPPMHYQFLVNKQPDSYYRIQDNRRYQNLKGYKTTISNPTWLRRDNYFYTPKRQHPFTKWTNNKNVKFTGSQATKYPWWNLPTRLKNSFVQRPSTRRFDQNIIRNSQQASYKPVKTFPGMGRSQHHIFPIFGKRSISDYKTQTRNESTLRYRRSGISAENLTKTDRLHIKHHRSTRHGLYERISTYLDGRGSNGHHCVLRALCETGQKSHEQRPGSFVGEIMRAIFTMPEPVDAIDSSSPQIGYKEQRYDLANSLTGNCASRYHLCKESLWSSHFVA